MTPTIAQVMKCYRIIAKTERMKTGIPCKDTVLNVLRGTRNVCRAAGIGLDESVEAITRRKVDLALAAFVERGLSRTSAWTYVCQLRAVFAKWCLPYYRDAGWDVRPPDLPAFRAMPARYERPSAEMLRRVKAWYSTLEGEMWFAATMMLEFAMRNGDVLRLKEENFVVKGDARYLSYVPHKTELSSGRRVLWPVHKDVWARIEDCGGMACLGVTDETFAEMNRQLRALGFRGHKGAYELRKICVDHVYQKFGVEMAVSISGDDVRTISRYYADPAQPNVGALRIVELL